MNFKEFAVPRCDASKCGQCQARDFRPVDIVAVHGLCETSSSAWTDLKTNVLWLKDLLPLDLHCVRVLSFSYHTSALAFFSPGGGDVLEGIAETLVQNLHSHRSLDGGEDRPIIFVCHGLGGIIAKKALIYASNQKARFVQHLYRVYVSTFALLLFSVPHRDLEECIWLDYEMMMQKPIDATAPRHPKRSGSRESAKKISRDVNSAFAHLLKQFRIYYFWEGAKTSFGNSEIFMVDQASAAPVVDNTERTCIASNHFGMVKCADRNSQTYRSILAPLVRFCQEAPPVIAHRWNLAEQNLQRACYDEAFELTGIVYDIDEKLHRRSLSGKETSKSAKKNIDLPRRASLNYVGRSAFLETLSNAFFSSSAKSQKVFILYGMGGTGKTEISIKFARDNQHQFSAIFTIQATDSEHVKKSYAEIGAYGGLESTERSGKYWLEQNQEPWLLIVDNADDPAIDLAALLPSADHGSILVTTRNPEFRKHNTVGYSHVGKLDKKEALALLLASANIEQGPPWSPAIESAGNQITKALGYLALAVRAAGASIFRKICKLQEYLEFHDDFRSRYRDLVGINRLSSENEANVYAAFGISHQWLKNQVSQTSRDALELLNIVAFYHFEHIHTDIFIRAKKFRLQPVTANSRPSFLGRASEVIVQRLSAPRAVPTFMKSATALKVYRVREALVMLGSLSMVFYDDKSDTFSLHPLVHTWIQDRMSKGEKALWASVALNILTDSLRLPSADATDDPGAYHRAVLPHLDVCLARSPLRTDIIKSMPAGVWSSVLMIIFPTLIFMIREYALDNAKCGYLYLTCGLFNEAVIYLSATRDALLYVLGPAHEKTMAAQLGLASAYWGLGQLSEAIKLQTVVAESRELVYGVDHVETLLARDHLAKSFWLNGQYKQALESQEDTIQKMKAQLAPDNSRLLAALDNLGVILGSWHRFEESLTAHQHVLRLRVQKNGPEDAETVTTKMYMAMALLDLGRLHEAHAEMITVYKARRKQLGKEHPYTLWALCYLSKVNVKLGSLDQAEEDLVEGIAAAKRSLDDNHLGVLMGCGELARVYSRQGRLAEACTLLEETVLRLKVSRGQHHPDYIFGLWKLAQIYRKQERYEEGGTLCELALHEAQSSLTLEHPLSILIATERKELEYLHTGSNGAIVGKDNIIPEELPMGREQQRTLRKRFLLDRAETV